MNQRRAFTLIELLVVRDCWKRRRIPIDCFERQLADGNGLLRATIGSSVVLKWLSGKFAIFNLHCGITFLVLPCLAMLEPVSEALAVEE